MTEPHERLTHGLEALGGGLRSDTTQSGKQIRKTRDRDINTNAESIKR